MPVRLRISELMRAAGLKSAYELARASTGRISERTAYRLVAADGAVANFSATTLEALADTFGVEIADLFERRRRGAKSNA